MVTLAAIPSTSVALVVTRSAMLGFSNGAAVAMGIVLGDLVFVLLALLGMTALAETMGSFFLAVRYLAGGYLIWLGINLLVSRPAPVFPVNGIQALGLVTSLITGFLITLSDIKAIFFYASLLPALVDIAALSGSDIAAIVSITVVTVAGVKLTYAYSARKLVSLTRGLKIERGAQVAAGGLMVGAGAYLLAKA